MAFDKIRDALFKKADEGKLSENPTPHDPEERDLIGYIKGELEYFRMTSSRVSAEGQWLTNAAYLCGFGDLYYDTAFRQFRPIPSGGISYRKNKTSVNLILPNIQNRLARLTKNQPRYDVRPNSTSDDDREAARLGVYIINQIWDQQRINKKRLDMTMVMQQCGYAYLKTCWDPSLGPKIPVQNINGEIDIVSLGDIRVDVVSPFEVFVDPLAKTQEEVVRLIHAKIQPMSYFRTQYPERGHLVKPEGVWLQSLDYQGRINAFTQNVGGSSNPSSAFAKDSAIEISYYEKPTYKNPNGRHVIFANGVLLKDDDLPIDEIAFSKFDDVIVGGKYMSESVITHMRPIQDQYNRNVRKRSDWVNKMLAGKWMAARGHGLHREALNDASGEVVEFDPVPGATEPKYMQPPAIPQYAYNEDDFLKGYINEIMGVSEVSKGQLPSASIPAIGMQVLQEADDTRIGTITEQNEYSYADTGRHILKYVSKYYDYPRLLKVSGKGMEYSVKSFQGADLRDSHDVIVIRGSTLPSSKVLKRQEIINLHQGGYLGNPQDPKVLENVLNMLEYGDIGEAWKDHSLDMAMIREQLQMIEQEQKPPVSEFDNHPLIFQEFNRYRKSEKFKRLSDLSQVLLLQTMEEHLQHATNMMAPETSDEGQNNPELQESTAAQELEQQVIAEEMGQAVPEAPEGEPLG